MIGFGNYHPVTNILYYIFVIFSSMFLMHPYSLGISFLCSFIYSILVNGKSAIKFNLIYMLPMLIFAAMLNPLFNHEGASIITYFPNGNPLTMESIIFGIAAGVMIVSVICWFSSFNKIMTTDKIVYLTGRLFPSLSLVLSMTLRFVPYFKRKLSLVSDTQKGLGKRNKTILDRIKNSGRILSIMITNALEDSVETADSMKSRGFGLRGRTSFSMYSFTLRDTLFLCTTFLLGIYIVAGYSSNSVEFSYFPTIYSNKLSLYSLSIFAAHLLLCSLPIIIHCKEVLLWKAIQSKI